MCHINLLIINFRTLEHEFDGVKTHFDDEVQQREECGHQVSTLGMQKARRFFNSTICVTCYQNRT